MIHRLLTKVRAWIHAKKIMRSLKEAEEVNAGRRPAKSLEEFLTEL